MFCGRYSQALVWFVTSTSKGAIVNLKFVSLKNQPVIVGGSGHIAIEWNGELVIVDKNFKSKRAFE